MMGLAYIWWGKCLPNLSSKNVFPSPLQLQVIRKSVSRAEHGTDLMYDL